MRENRAIRVDDERTQVANVRGYCSVFQVVDELESLFLGACVNRDDGAALAVKLLLNEIVIGIALQCGVVDLDDFETLQKFSELQGVIAKAFHAESESFKPERVQECGSGCETTTNIAPDAVAELCEISELAKALVFFQALVFGVIPLEFSAIDDDAADGTAVSVDVLGRGVDNDICAKVKRMNKVRSCRRAVDNQRDACFVCDICNALNINDIEFRVADKFCKNCLGLIAQLRTNALSGNFCDVTGFNAECFQIVEQVDRAAKQCRTCNNFVAGLQNVQKRKRYCCHARRACDRANALFKRCNAPFERICRGVSNARICKTRSPIVKNSFEFLCGFLRKCTDLINRGKRRAGTSFTFKIMMQ